MQMTSTSHPALLDGKNVVVLGGTSGIGLAAAKAFIAAGARLVVVGLPSDDPESVKEQLGESTLLMFADAREPHTAEAAVGKTVEIFGKLDGLYHVAGGSGRRLGDGPLHEVTDEGWLATLELNLTPVFYSNRAAVRQFLLQKSGGSVLNLSSVLAFSPSPHHFGTHAYATAKAGIIGLTKSCAGMYAPQGIRFNVIAPGLIATPMSKRARASPEIAEFIRSKQPLEGGRFGEPEDLAAAAVFFMSDQSRFVTGQVLGVDGGWSVSDGQVAFTPDQNRTRGCRAEK